MSTYLVTAANRGIGLELARQLVAAGETVVGTARAGAETADLEALGARVETLDVTDGASVRALAERLESEPLDVLINNAGTYGDRSPFEELDLDVFVETYDVNALGPVRVTQALLPNLRLGEGRTIAHLTSRMGSIDDNTSGNAYPYRMSKAALNMFNKSLSVDLAGEGFTCVVLHPGWVRTRMGGASAPVEVADSVAGMLRVLRGLGPADTGAFLDFQGERIPW